MLRRLAQTSGAAATTLRRAAALLSTSASASPSSSSSAGAGAAAAGGGAGGGEKLYKYLTPASMLEGRPLAVERALSIENADAKERKQAEKQARIGQFGVRPGDTGSTPVQVACLTVRIEHMKAHCAANKQDKAAKRAYTMLLTRRRDLLQYLRRKDFAAYIRTLEELGITGFS